MNCYHLMTWSDLPFGTLTDIMVFMHILMFENKYGLDFCSRSVSHINFCAFWLEFRCAWSNVTKSAMKKCLKMWMFDLWFLKKWNDNGNVCQICDDSSLETVRYFSHSYRFKNNRVTYYFMGTCILVLLLCTGTKSTKLKQ